jgi:hypothetical protein
MILGVWIFFNQNLFKVPWRSAKRLAKRTHPQPRVETGEPQVGIAIASKPDPKGRGAKK